MSYTPQKLIDNKIKYPEEPALSVKQNNEWDTMNWSEYYDFVLKISFLSSSTISVLTDSGSCSVIDSSDSIYSV